MQRQYARARCWLAAWRSAGGRRRRSGARDATVGALHCLPPARSKPAHRRCARSSSLLPARTRRGQTWPSPPPMAQDFRALIALREQELAALRAESVERLEAQARARGGARRGPAWRRAALSCVPFRRRRQHCTPPPPPRPHSHASTQTRPSRAAKSWPPRTLSWRRCKPSLTARCSCWRRGMASWRAWTVCSPPRVESFKPNKSC